MSEPKCQLTSSHENEWFFSTSPTGIYDDWSLDSDIAKKVSN